MENIIFCGGCGTFISANEISAGKASKINNIYYCQKCSSGTQSAPARPASVPQTQRPVQARPTTVPPRQAAPASGQPQIKRPAPQPTVAVPLQQRPGAVPSQPRPNPVAPTARQAVPTTPASRPQAQKPLSARPTVPEGQIRAVTPVSQPARPAVGPVRVTVKPAPLQQTQKAAPFQPPARTSQTSRIRPAQVATDISDEGIEELDVPSLHRFGKAKSAKGGIKKIYLIAGAAVVVLIVVISIIISMSNAAKQKSKDDYEAKLKKYYKEVEETENDFADNPQKVIDKIKERREALKGTEYEKKIDTIEQNAKARIEITDKIKELEKPVDTAEEVDKRLKEISALKSNPAVNESLGGKLRELLTLFTKQKKKLAEEEKKTREEQDAAEKKAYENFKAKIESLRNEKNWKEMLRECDILLGRPNGLQYQDEADKIKEEAKAAMEEQQEKAKKRKEWQVLNDDITKWDRSGDSKSEVYVDEENKIILKNPNSSSNRGAVTSINNNNENENWKDFTMTVEFKVLSGSFDMLLRGRMDTISFGTFTFQAVTGIPIPFPRKFKDEWQKYTIELKGKKLTISGTGLTEPKTSDVPEGAGGIGINVKGGDNIIVKELKVKVTE